MNKNAQYIFYLHIFHQRFPNMVKRLFVDVIHDAIWFMNIHEQNRPWFLAMGRSISMDKTNKVTLNNDIWSFCLPPCSPVIAKGPVYSTGYTSSPYHHNCTKSNQSPPVFYWWTFGNVNWWYHQKKSWKCSFH